jgi:hypothetical protein
MNDEIKVGQKIVCVENDGNIGNCSKCIFSEMISACNSLCCLPRERSDGKNVHFELEKEEPEI